VFPHVLLDRLKYLALAPTKASQAGRLSSICHQPLRLRGPLPAGAQIGDLPNGRAAVPSATIKRSCLVTRTSSMRRSSTFTAWRFTTATSRSHRHRPGSCWRQCGGRGQGPPRTRKAMPRRHPGRIIHPLCPFPPARTVPTGAAARVGTPSETQSRQADDLLVSAIAFHPKLSQPVNKQCLVYPQHTREPVSPPRDAMSARAGGSQPGQTARPRPTTRPRPIPPTCLFLRRASERKSHLKSQRAQTSGHSSDHR
jgi:hypothetical protein